MSEHRDVLTANLVNQMVALGGFKEEINIYGTAGWYQGETFYCVSSHREKLEEYRNRKIQNGAICFPIVKKRDYVNGITQERLEQTREKKEAMLRQMKAQYEPDIMGEVRELVEQRNPGSAKEQLKTYREMIDGNYEELELQILESLSWTAFEIGAINGNTYKDFLDYIEKIRFQMRENPVQQDLMQRTFYGFGWQAEEGLHLQMDAEKTVCYDRYYEAIKQDRKPGAILHKTYYFPTMGDVIAKREEFRTFLTNCCDERYFSLSDGIWDCREPEDEEMELQLEKCTKQNPDVIRYYHALRYKRV